MGYGRAFPHQMGTKQAHGPTNSAVQIWAVFTNVLLAQNRWFPYFAGTTVGVQEKSKNYYSIMTYAKNDATRHNNSKKLVALKFLKTTITVSRAISRVGQKPRQNMVFHVQLQQLAKKIF